MRCRALIQALVAALAVMSIGCHDTCFLVVGCGDTRRFAVEGQVVETVNGQPVPGTRVTLVAAVAAVAESTQTVTDAQGVFALSLPGGGASDTAMTLRVVPPGKPGYSLPLAECKPVTRWGDSCVLNPLVAEPSFPLFKFVYRSDATEAAANVRVTFTRTGGSALFGRGATPTVQVTTDATGIVLLFPPGVFAGGLDPVVGDLVVDLPPPIGSTVRHNYAVPANPRFNTPLFALQLTGPTLDYALSFIDSTSGRPVKGVDVTFQRVSGVATASPSRRSLSDDKGLAVFGPSPLAQGTVSGDLTITPPGSSFTTPMQGISITTFDADSAIVLSRWKVGATGRLYPVPPPAP